VKIPNSRVLNTENIHKLWREAASKMSLEYGVYVDFKWEYSGDLTDPKTEERIYFEVASHQFESLRDLRKALRNKIFL
jgi:hypothetical protein